MSPSEPDYACAIITDPRGWLWLQLRSSNAQYAADQLTCFGGRRETDEGAAGCLNRELREELAWQPSALGPTCDLWRGTRFIARFFACTCSIPLRARETDQVALAVPPAALPGLPLSSWHAAALSAWRRGHPRADLIG